MHAQQPDVANDAPLVDGATGQGVLGIVGYWYQPGPTIAHDPLDAISLGAQRTVRQRPRS